MSHLFDTSYALDRASVVTVLMMLGVPMHVMMLGIPMCMMVASISVVMVHGVLLVMRDRRCSQKRTVLPVTCTVPIVTVMAAST